MKFLNELKREWPFLNEDDTDSYIYLDNASTSFPKPKEVYEFMYRFYKMRGVSPGRACSSLIAPVNQLFSDTRKKLTKFFNGGDDHNRLIFTYNATHSSNIIIHGLLSRGDHVISSCLDHNAMLRPLNHLQRDYQVDVDYIPFDNNGFIDLEKLENAIKPNTKLVSIIHGSNVLGTIQPLKEISAIIEKHDILFISDISQTAGIIPIDMKDMGIDIIIFPGHKSLYGPTGIGGIYIREGIPIKAWQQGGTGIRSEDEFHIDEYPYHLETGTNNILGIAGLYAGISYIEEKGMDNLYNHEMSLYDRLITGIKNFPKVITYCTENRNKHLPVLSFNIEGYKATEIGNILDKQYNISSRPGLHCAPKVHTYLNTLDTGTVRLSIGFFNTEADIDRTIDAIKEISNGSNVQQISK